MKSIFKDDRLDREFRTYGYVVIPRFLDAQECLALESFYLDHHPPAPSGFHATMYCADSDWRREVYQTIANVFHRKVDALLADHHCCCCNYMTKEGGDPSSELELHQDWSHVEEPEQRAVHIWTPTVDTTIENGCLALVPGSHHLSDPIRPFGDTSPFQEHMDLIRAEFLRRLPVAAGTAIAYDGGMLHGSAMNQTARTRVAVQCIATPRHATMTHAWRIDADTVEVHHVDTEFFFQYQLHQPPKNSRAICRKHYRVRQRTLDELRTLAHYAKVDDST